MSDASSYTSLLDLVSSHLSKYNVQDSPSHSVDGTPTNSIPIPSPNGLQKVVSDSCLIPSGERVPLPKYCISDSPIKNVLAEQISNMVKAKERKAQEKRQRLEEDMNKLALEDNKDDEYVIDLLTAIQTPITLPQPTEAVIARSDSFESLLVENTKRFIEHHESSETDEQVEEKIIHTLLPCQTDISYILPQKLDKVKCSTFGKILTARLRPVPAPYLKVKIKTDNVTRFHFNTKSPCDLIKEKLRKPTSHNTQCVNLMDIIMGTNDNT